MSDLEDIPKPDPNRVRFMYLKDPLNPRRILTVSRQIVEKTDSQARATPPQLVLGLALCSPLKKGGKGDRFTKEEGRKISVARMKDPESNYKIPLFPGETIGEQIRLTVMDFLKFLSEDPSRRRLQRIAMTRILQEDAKKGVPKRIPSSPTLTVKASK